MGMYRVTNFLMLTEDYDGYMDIDGMMKNGIGAVIDLRTKLPDNYVSNERLGLARARIHYELMPFDKQGVGPFMWTQRICQSAMWTMADGFRVALHQNEGQSANGFIAMLSLAKMGLTPKAAMEMVIESEDMGAPEEDKKGDDLSVDQKEFLNLYGEYMVQKPFFKDPNEEMVFIRKMMDMMDKEHSGANDQEKVAAMLRTENFLLGKSTEVRSHEKKPGCGCGGA